jgi:hypothetical protein
MAINKTDLPSSKKQRQLLAMARQQLDIEDGDYRALMEEFYGVDSSTRLTFGDAEAFIDYFITKGFVLKTAKRRYVPGPGRKKSRRNAPNVVHMAGVDELAKIDALAGLISWKYEDGPTRWMKKFLKIERVKTARDAFRVIEGLKKMFENGMVKAHGKDWWLMDHGDTEINAYIAEYLPVRYKGMVVPALYPMTA